MESADPFKSIKSAFRADDAATVRKILESYPALKQRINEPIGDFGGPAITHARSREMLDVLLDNGADINAKSDWKPGGFGLLHSAKPDLAEYAIQRGAIIDAHAAARLGLDKKLRELIETDSTLVHARGGDGQTPLHFASTVPIAEFLLAQGADIDARDLDHNSTPAQWMIGERQAVARYLVERGCRTDLLMAAAQGDAELAHRHLEDDPACIRMRISDEYFPMVGGGTGGTIYQWTLGWHVSAHDVAKKFGHDAVYRFLLERSPADVRFVHAAWTADGSTVKQMLKQNPRLVSELTPADRRLLAHAARNNQTETVRVMLEAAGWPVDSTSQHGATPLHWAAFHGNAEMTRQLLQHNPPLSTKDPSYQSTPLGWAIHGSENGWNCAQGDYAGTVKLLLEAGAVPPAEITSGTTAVRQMLQAKREGNSKAKD